MQNLASATYSVLKEKSKLSAKALSPHEKYKFAYNLARVSTHSSANPFSGNVHYACPNHSSIWSFDSAA